MLERAVELLHRQRSDGSVGHFVGLLESQLLHGGIRRKPVGEHLDVLGRHGRDRKRGERRVGAQQPREEGERAL